jgi:hypothetical protein
VLEPHPSGADDRAVCLRDHDREIVRIRALLRLEALCEPGGLVVFLPDVRLHRCDPVEVGSLGHLA